MKRPKEITAELKKANLPLSKYVTQLEKENLKLHTRIAKLQVENVSYQNEAKAAKKSKPPVTVIVQTDSERSKKLHND